MSRKSLVVPVSLVVMTLLAAGVALAADELEIVSLNPASGAVNALTTGVPGPGNSVEVTFRYRLDSAAKGQIGAYTAGVVGNPPHEGVNVPYVVTQGSGTIKHRFTVKCNPTFPPPIAISNLRVAMFELDAGGNVVGTLVEKFRQVSFTFNCQVPGSKPDLLVSLTVPSAAKAGQDIGPMTKVVAKNAGTAPAPGTVGTLSPANGYMIDVVLSKDTTVPPGFAVYSAHFAEDVLLQGGRISNTEDLPPAGTKAYPTGGGIPADTPTGGYYVCAFIDPGAKVAESNEANNVACKRIKIEGSRLAVPPVRP